jgi:HEAT repeat protein
LTHPVLARLSDPDPETRAAACRDAADDPAAVLLVDALGSALGDPDRRVAQSASDALARLAVHAPEVGPLVRDALRADSANQRIHAAFTCARIEPPGPRIVPALVEALASEEGDVRWSAARLLVNTGRSMGEILPLAMGLMRGDENAWVRSMAVYCVRDLAPGEPEAVHAVIEACNDPDVRVRHAALTALAASFDSAAALECLVNAVADSPDPAARRIAVFSLGNHAARAQQLPEHVVHALKTVVERDSEPGLREAAQRALAQLQR